MTTVPVDVREWLERSLIRSGPGRRIVSLRERKADAWNSDVRHLEITWSPDGDGDEEGDPPTRVVWKRGDPREVEIVRLLGTAGPLPVARCYAADERGLLLEDLSATHEEVVPRADLLAGRGDPGGDRVERVVDALADLHAAFWESSRLGQGELAVRAWFRDEESHARHVERRRAELAAFREAEPDSEFTELYGMALRVIERLWTPEWARRLETRHGLALVHGDAYLNQFLLPRDGNGPAVVLDLGDATANPGAWDLAFLLATFWTPEQRARGGREAGLLRRYRERLGSRGVHMPAGELLDDYRRMVAFLVFDPVWNCTDGSSRAYWEPKMRCLAGAWRDLDCAALAQGGRRTP